MAHAAQVLAPADPVIVAGPGFVRITPPVDMALREMLARIEGLGHWIRGLPSPGVLIDMREHTHVGPTENVLLGHHCGQHLRGARVAVLVPCRDGQGQQAARRLGLDMRSFEDEDWALDWLRGEG